MNEEEDCKPVTFYRKDVLCPKCNTPFTILRMFISPMGHLHFDTLCVKCGEDGTWITDFISLITWAVKKNDVQALICEGNELIN